MLFIRVNLQENIISILLSQFLTPHLFRERIHRLLIENRQSIVEYLNMAANQSAKIQFINSYCPGDTISAQVQRKAHSHAARTAHAKSRRLRMCDYQAGKTKQIPRDHQGDKELRIMHRGSALSTFDATEIEKSVHPSPATLLASDRKDPFCSFARPFKPIEHYLLDHCEFLYEFYSCDC
jgi:hypothetical protein